MHISKRVMVAVATVIGAAACGEAPVSSHFADSDGAPGLTAAVLTPATTFPGDRVRTTNAANIRSGPAFNTAMVGVQPLGALGTVISGPVVDASGDRLTRWQIDFDTGPDGWAADPYLDQITSGPNIGSITLTPATVAAAFGDTVRLAATVKDSAGQVLTGVALTWNSSNPAAATVSTAGLVTTLAAGTTTITATSRGKSGTATMTVAKFVIGGRVRPNGGVNVRSAAAGSAALLGAQPDSVSGVVVGGPVVDVAGDRLTRWQVDFDAGPDGWAAESYLQKSSAPAPAALVSLTPDTAIVLAGRTLQLTAVAKDAAGTTLPSAPMNFASLDTTKARVAATGLVTGVAAGTALIIASSGPTRDTSRITVIPVPVAAVAITPATATVQKDSTVQLAATTTDSAGAALTGRIIAWTTSNAAVATVTAAGQVRGVAGGAATITATSEGKSGSAALTVTVPAAPMHTGYYVSPSGTSAGNGTIGNPWDLKTALAGAGGRVVGGDTIWLRGGVYRGAFSSTVSGQSGRPVVVRQYPGERAIIDGAGTPSNVSVLRVGGQWSVFWGFEITNTDQSRYTTSLTNSYRPNVVANYANNTKYINLVVHDGGVAFYNETNYSNVEITGCIIYNNGWDAPDRGHGHALYLKSTAGPVVARDNIIFNQFGWGVHVYTNAGQGYLNNIQVEGNVSFNNGTISTEGTSANILLGGGGTATGDVVRNNLTYYSPGAGGINVRIGMNTVQNGTVQVQNNYFVGGTTVLDVGFWQSIVLSGNTFIGSGNVVTLNDAATSGQTWSFNTHQRDPLAAAWRWSGSAFNFVTWKTRSLAGLGDLVAGGLPTGNKVVVQPSPYEAGRGHVTVYNWTGAGSVTVDLSGVLNPGDQYEVRNVQDLFGAPVASGTYSGAVTLPMNGVTPPAPVGFTSSRAPKTGPNFDVFVVTRI